MRRTARRAGYSLFELRFAVTSNIVTPELSVAEMQRACSHALGGSKARFEGADQKSGRSRQERMANRQ
jgi:hypothetical protein